MGSNIYLVGYRGTGKSSLGKKLAKLLGYKLVDLDKEIVKKAGMSIPEIFSNFGEPHFRVLERECILFFGAKDHQVIATGGGIVVDEDNRSFLKEEPFVVLLETEIPILYSRIYGDKNRPALTKLNPLDEIKQLIQIRDPYYREVSDLVFDTSVGSFQEFAKQIAKIYLADKS